MSFTHTGTLAVDVFLLVVCVLQILANFVVVYVWVTSKRLFRNDNLVLLVGLAVIDFAYAILQFPLLTYLLMEWVPDGLPWNYSGTFLYWLGSFSAALMKSGCTVTTFIALDRIFAMHWPVMYYRQHKRVWCFGAFFISIGMAAIDWIIQIATVPVVERKPECSAFGCFMTSQFKIYWGLSNCVMNLLSCLLTIVIMYHLYRRAKLRDVHTQQVERENRSKIDRSANRVAFYILIVSAVIGVVPGCLNGLSFFYTSELLNEVSYFVGTCATLSGLSHAFIFAMAHREIRVEIAKRLIATFLPDGIAAEATTRMPRQSRIQTVATIAM